MTASALAPSTVLHVGFHKTGTTTLQGKFFPALQHTAVLGPKNPGFAEFRTAARRLCWDSDGDTARDDLRRQFASARATSDRLVVSLEDFSYWHQEGRTARRLHELLPDARVVICVRDQRTLLYSRYVGWLKKGGSSGFEPFLRGLDPAWLEFDTIVESYQQLYGKAAVKVLPYELFARDSDRFLAELSAFVAPAEPVPQVALGVVNRSLAPPTRVLLRATNRLVPRRGSSADDPRRLAQRGPRFGTRIVGWDSRLFPNMPRVAGRRDAATAARYAARYAAGNARLEHLAGLSLSTYGYLVAGDEVLSRD